MVSVNSLMRGSPIVVPNICTIRQPTLDDIFNLPDNEYELYLNILSIELRDYVDKLQDLNSLSPVQKMLSEKLSLCQLLLTNDHTATILIKALMFYITDNISVDTTGGTLLINNKPMTEVDFMQIKNVILQINGLHMDQPKETLKFANKKAKEIYEKCMAGKQKRERQKSGADIKTLNKMKLDNMVGYVASHSYSYNLINIWQLTIYQLYDQFKRFNLYTQLDTITKRWATWGKEDFDFSVYFDNVNKSK